MIVSYNMKKMTIRLSADIFDYCKSYGQVIERFEVISLFNMVDDMHSEVCKFTIREGIPVGSDQVQLCLESHRASEQGP